MYWYYIGISQTLDQTLFPPYGSNTSVNIHGRCYVKYVFTLKFINSKTSLYRHNSSVISQKGESQKWCFKKAKHVEFSEKRTFRTP